MRGAPAVSVPPAGAKPLAPLQGQRAAEYIVALVNSEPITNTEVQKRVDRMLQENSDPQIQNMPRDQLVRQVLDQMINERAQLQLAKEDGVRVDEAAIEQGVALVARQNNLSVPELEQRITQAGLSKDEFRDNVRRQLLLTRLREQELQSKVSVSDAEVDQYLRDQRANTAGAGSLNLAQILVAVPEKASAAQVAALQKRAQELADRARKGEDFAQLAKEYSDAPGAKSDGGAFGLRPADRYPSLFTEATQSTPVGGVAGPLRSGAGFHVLKVLDRQRGASANADAVVTQTQVRHILLRTDGSRTTAQAIALLNDYKHRIQAGTATFADLARQYSQDPGSASQGGELGWTGPGTFVPEFEDAMNRLQPGQISDPIVSRFGVHLIQVEGRRDAKLNNDELREAARAAIRDKKMDEAYAAWAQDVRNKAYIEYRDPPQN
jgi:peptidyl-prolyl cis-trans isomerase SurA